MIEDQIALALKELERLKLRLKEIRVDLRYEEKIDTNEYIDLKKAYKDMREQVKEMEDQSMKELLSDASYIKLKELKMQTEEEVAHANKKLFDLVGQLPPRPWDTHLDTENGQIRVQIRPEMRIYLNGKEEKKRA